MWGDGRRRTKKKKRPPTKEEVRKKLDSDRPISGEEDVTGVLNGALDRLTQATTDQNRELVKAAKRMSDESHLCRERSSIPPIPEPT